jgi:hypothetical protein
MNHSLATRANVTGRDGYILGLALAYAILAIERLPERWQQGSDAENMRQLLDHLTERADFFISIARGHLQRGLELVAE